MLLHPRLDPGACARGARNEVRHIAVAMVVIGALVACSGSAAPDLNGEQALAEPSIDEVETTGSEMVTSEPVDRTATASSVPATDPADRADGDGDSSLPPIGTVVDGNVGPNDPADGASPPVVGTVVDGNLGPRPVPVPGPTVARPLDDEIDFGTGVVAAVVDVEAVEVEARFPGERSGPGVVVSIEVDNGSTDPISLDFVTVDLIRRDGASAIPVELVGSSALAGELEPGATATGRYQFFIPADQRVSATVSVNYAASEPTALFIGDLPDV